MSGHVHLHTIPRRWFPLSFPLFFVLVPHLCRWTYESRSAGYGRFAKFERRGVVWGSKLRIRRLAVQSASTCSILPKRSRSTTEVSKKEGTGLLLTPVCFCERFRRPDPRVLCSVITWNRHTLLLQYRRTRCSTLSTWPTLDAPILSFRFPPLLNRLRT